MVIPRQRKLPIPVSNNNSDCYHAERSEVPGCFRFLKKDGSFIPLCFVQDDTDVSEQTPGSRHADFSCHSERSEESIKGKYTHCLPQEKPFMIPVREYQTLLKKSFKGKTGRLGKKAGK
jgi:hypothetical protein